MQGQRHVPFCCSGKVRVVHALDQLGVLVHRSRLPGFQTRKAELFELLAGETLEQAAICAFGMTRRRRVEADRDEALQLLPRALLRW